MSTRYKFIDKKAIYFTNPQAQGSSPVSPVLLLLIFFSISFFSELLFNRTIAYIYYKKKRNEYTL